MNRPLTPDFYEYPWTPVQRARVDGRFVEIGWADGAQLRAFDQWLLESAVGVGGVDPETREGLLDPANHDPNLRVDSVEVDAEGGLRVTFSPDAVSAAFHPGWLHHVAAGAHLPDAWLPPPAAWLAETLSEPPTHDGSQIDGDVLAAFVNDMLRFGLARLRGVPDADAGTSIAAQLGGARMTNFGAFWDVQAIVEQAGDPVTNSTANTNLRLGPHTDLPSRETPPGFQFLHCVVNEVEGGRSTMADGAAVVEALRTEQPDDYDALTTLRWVFFNRGAGIDHRWSGPMIDLGVHGSPLTIRAFYPVRAFPDMPEAEIPRAYAAMRRFASMADEPRFRLSTPFEPGDLVGFDNRRILHGREAFESGGARHLRGFYVDRDDVLSFARVHNRKNTAHA